MAASTAMKIKIIRWSLDNQVQLDAKLKAYNLDWQCYPLDIDSLF